MRVPESSQKLVANPKTLLPKSRDFTASPLLKYNPFTISPLQAPGSRIKRLAKSALEERGPEGVTSGLRLAANGDLQHAERDLLSLFRSLGMSMEVRISQYRFGLTVLPHMKVRDWWSYLLKKRSPLVLGGFERHQPEAELAMECFWQNLRGCMPDHSLYSTHNDRLEDCVPFLLFLDEGTGLRKSGVLVVSMQPIVGKGTASKFLSEMHNSARELDRAGLKQLMSECQEHNAAGRTYDSRFLYTVLPKKTYHKTGNLTKLLDKLADECIDVMRNGLQVGSKVYYPVCLGVKGDAPMLMRVGNMTRGFTHMGAGRGCCFECQAGEPGFHFEDTTLSPDWESSVHTVRPYTDPSPLLRIPAWRVPEQFFRRDPFHTFKQSIGCSFLSSSIVLLTCDFGYFHVPGSSDAVAELLGRAYADFAHWTKKEWHGKTMQSLKMFTKDLFHWSRKDAFPAGRFKGGDCMLMLRWLQHLLTHGFVSQSSDPPCRQGPSPVLTPMEIWHKPFLESMLEACEAGLRFFHLMHRNGIWHNRELTHEMGLCAAKFTSSFSRLAQLCHGRQLPRFHLVPSLHAMHHFFLDSKHFLERRPRQTYCLSAAVSGCEADEDFVGKVARLTRKVHARSTAQRTLERYCVKMWCETQNLR